MDQFTEQNLIKLAEVLELSTDDPDFVAITAVASVRIRRLTEERDKLREQLQELADQLLMYADRPFLIEEANRIHDSLSEE